MIHLKDINKTYNNGQPLHVLKGINLDIEQGEFVSIMGSAGSCLGYRYFTGSVRSSLPYLYVEGRAGTKDEKRRLVF